VATDTLAGPRAPTRHGTADAAPPRRRRRYLYDASPWRRGDALRGNLLTAVGVAITACCWYRVSGEVTLRDQQGWVVGCVLGLVLALLGGVSWLLAGFRSVRLGQRQLLADIALVLHRPTAPDGDSATAPAQVGTGWVIGRGMTLIHQPDCPIARGKAVAPIGVAEAAERGFAQCGMCQSGMCDSS
jgi:hypothetical protein